MPTQITTMTQSLSSPLKLFHLQTDDGTVVILQAGSLKGMTIDESAIEKLVEDDPDFRLRADYDDVDDPVEYVKRVLKGEIIVACVVASVGLAIPGLDSTVRWGTELRLVEVDGYDNPYLEEVFEQLKDELIDDLRDLGVEVRGANFKGKAVLHGK